MPGILLHTGETFEASLSFGDLALYFRVYAAQLNTIRHVVIWLDPRSCERDLRAAVVDR